MQFLVLGAINLIGARVALSPDLSPEKRSFHQKPLQLGWFEDSRECCRWGVLSLGHDGQHCFFSLFWASRPIWGWSNIAFKFCGSCLGWCIRCNMKGDPRFSIFSDSIQMKNRWFQQNDHMCQIFYLQRGKSMFSLQARGCQIGQV